VAVRGGFADDFPAKAFTSRNNNNRLPLPFIAVNFVIASAAKQSIKANDNMDCFDPAGLAMT
jgi:hypothetical protein